VRKDYRGSETVKTILLVRHGQSQEQNGESADGMNSQLSELGIRQARKLEKRLSTLRFDLALVSPLQRAWQTFEISQPAVAAAELDSRLIEVDFAEGWYAPIAGYLPDRSLPVRNSSAWLAPVEDRVRDLVEELVASPWQRIVLFSHQGTLKQLIAAWLGLPGDGFMYGLVLGNTSLSGLTLAADGTRSIHFLNDVAHLDEAEGGLCPDLSVRLDERRPWRANVPLWTAAGVIA
jgi:broad specificity phosphatase PhoE